MEGFHAEGGLFGISGHNRAASITVDGLTAMQHRGDQGAGVASSDGYVLHSWRGFGTVAQVFSGPQLQSLTGTTSVGQVVRLSHAALRTDSAATGIGPEQPLVARVRGGRVAVAMVGTFLNSGSLRNRLQDQGAAITTTTDAELLLQLMAQSVQRTAVNRLVDALWKVDGAFSAVLLADDRLVGVRDPRGVKSLWIGRLGAGTILATEDGAIRAVGGEVTREVKPGEMIIIDSVGMRTVTPFSRKESASCLQEYISLARGDAHMFRRAVYPVRVALGERLAKTQPAPRGELVVGMPGTGAPFAIGFGRSSELPVEQGLMLAVGGDSGDTYTGISSVVADKNVVLVVSTLVTGNAVAKAVHALHVASAAEVHVRVASPKVNATCIYGVIGPTSDELVAGDADALFELTQKMGADSVGFLPLQELLQVTSEDLDDECKWCDGCFTQQWPIPPEVDGQLPLFEAESADEPNVS